MVTSKAPAIAVNGNSRLNGIAEFRVRQKQRAPPRRVCRAELRLVNITSLLNRELSVHAKRLVRRAEVLVRALWHALERNDIRLARVVEQWTRERGHGVLHVRVQLRLRIR